MLFLSEAGARVDIYSRVDRRRLPSTVDDPGFSLTLRSGQAWALEAPEGLPADACERLERLEVDARRWRDAYVSVNDQVFDRETVKMLLFLTALALLSITFYSTYSIPSLWNIFLGPWIIP